MNQITTQYVTENGACYEQYVITDPAAKTSLTITPERGGMITGFTLDGDEYIWTQTVVMIGGVSYQYQKPLTIYLQTKSFTKNTTLLMKK